MARRNQPYIPLYADDFQTDEKLIMCSAESTGVYIRIMCLMHKSDPYGKILLKQKFKQTHNQILNFASQLAIFFPYERQLIERSLSELVGEDVLQIEGDLLVQKRMVRDSEISEIRRDSGKKGGQKSAEKRSENTRSNADDFAQAKSQANTGNGIGNTNGIVITDDKEKGSVRERGLTAIKKELAPRTPDAIRAYFAEHGQPQEADKFIDYYQSNGWKVGRNAMKDWQATARNWMRRAQPDQKDRRIVRNTTVADIQDTAKRLAKLMGETNEHDNDSGA